MNDCEVCKHRKSNINFRPPISVCTHPAVLKAHGSQGHGTACTVARAGACGINGRLWQKEGR